MKIKVEQEEKPVEKVKVSFKEAGRRGGLAKVPKGFSMMDKDRLRQLSIDAVKKRWARAKGERWEGK